MSGKVQIATFHELVSKKTGETYLKAAFGPVDLHLFKDTANPIIRQDGQRTHAWNLVIAQNYLAVRIGRPHVGLGSPVEEEQAPE